MTIEKATVIIPTTQGLCVVQRLEQEDPAVARSTVCIRGTTELAGIESDYNAFVRVPTGIVEREFGSAAWRADVSAPIDAGQSWQLGLYAAHALLAERRLYEPLRTPQEPSQTTVVATGLVRSIDLAVGDVGHVAEKLEHVLAANLTGHVLVLLPRANVNDVPVRLRSALSDRGHEIIAVDHVNDLRDALRLRPPGLSLAASGTEKRVINAPFPGLRSFEASDREVFFGRARAREEVLSQLVAAAAFGVPFLLIHGKSGIGKSSLLRAGLAGDLLARQPDDRDWSVALVDAALVTKDPKHALALALAGTSLKEDPATDANLFVSQTDPLLDVLEELEKSGHSVLLLIDQFEQLLKPGVGKLLRRLVDTGYIWIAAAIRTDRLSDLIEDPDLAFLVDGTRSYLLDSPSPYEISEIIVEPTRLAGLEFEKGEGTGSLPDRLSSFALSAPDSLPLLQLALSRLAEMAGPGGKLKEADLEPLGGLEGAIGTWAEATVSKLIATGISENEIQNALLSLVRFDNGVPSTRGVDLSKAEDAQHQTLAKLLEDRILVSDAPDGTTTLRLSHEVLLSHWDRLHDLVDKTREDLVLRDILEDAASRWEDDGKAKPDLIMNPTRLHKAEKLLTNDLVSLQPSTKAYIEASLQQARAAASVERRTAQLRKRTRAELRKKRTQGARLRNAVLALSLALAVVSSLGYLRSTHLLNETDRLLKENKRQTAVLLARDTLRLTEAGHVSEAMQQLNRAFTEIPGKLPHDVYPPALAAIERAANETTFAVDPGEMVVPLHDGFYVISEDRRQVRRLNPDGSFAVVVSNAPSIIRTVSIFDAIPSIIYADQTIAPIANPHAQRNIEATSASVGTACWGGIEQAFHEGCLDDPSLGYLNRQGEYFQVTDTQKDWVGDWGAEALCAVFAHSPNYSSVIQHRVDAVTGFYRPAGCRRVGDLSLVKYVRPGNPGEGVETVFGGEAIIAAREPRLDSEGMDLPNNDADIIGYYCFDFERTEDFDAIQFGSDWSSVWQIVLLRAVGNVATVSTSNPEANEATELGNERCEQPDSYRQSELSFPVKIQTSRLYSKSGTRNAQHFDDLVLMVYLPSMSQIRVINLGWDGLRGRLVDDNASDAPQDTHDTHDRNCFSRNNQLIPTEAYDVTWNDERESLTVKIGDRASFEISAPDANGRYCLQLDEPFLVVEGPEGYRVFELNSDKLENLVLQTSDDSGLHFDRESDQFLSHTTYDVHSWQSTESGWQRTLVGTSKVPIHAIGASGGWIQVWQFGPFAGSPPRLIGVLSLETGTSLSEARTLMMPPDSDELRNLVQKYANR